MLAATVFGLAECAQVLHFSNYFDTYENDVAQTLKQHTAPTDKLIVWGQVWGEPFMRAERQGLTGGFTLRDTGWLNDARTLARLKELGYTKLVLVNPSPLTVALTAVTGSHLSQTLDLPQFLPAAATNWPVAFNSTLVLIVEIPK